jgi:hypothetical protein
MRFGIVCEGFTDKPTIKNILCGYFSIQNPNREIAELQPPFGQTDGGGWRPLLQYLTSLRFQDDVLNNEVVILHIDTDVSMDFDVPHVDNNGNELSVEDLVRNISNKLISKINEGLLDFYTDNANKIIFAISIHSIECWLVAYYAEHAEIHNCFEVLRMVKLPNNIQVSKKQRTYEKLSQPFLDLDNIHIVAQKSPSFHLFIQQLHNIHL